MLEMTQMQNMNGTENCVNLRDVQRAQFVLTEMTLFLDSHEDDRAALDFYSAALEKYLKVRDAYEAEYGALTFDSAYSDEQIRTWTRTPWPWEKEANF